MEEELGLLSVGDASIAKSVEATALQWVWSS